MRIKNIVPFFIFFGCTFFVTDNIFAQSKVSKKAIYLESFGTSFSGFTINFGYRLSFRQQINSGVLLSVGAGYNPFNIGYREEKNQYIIPLNASIYYKNLEVGIGLTHTDIYKLEFIPTSSISYTFKEGNVFLKPSINGLYLQADINTEGCGHRDLCDPKRLVPFPGLSFGYIF